MPVDRAVAFRIRAQHPLVLVIAEKVVEGDGRRPRERPVVLGEAGARVVPLGGAETHLRPVSDGVRLPRHHGQQACGKGVGLPLVAVLIEALHDEPGLGHPDVAAPQPAGLVLEGGLLAVEARVVIGDGRHGKFSREFRGIEQVLLHHPPDPRGVAAEIGEDRVHDGTGQHLVAKGSPVGNDPIAPGLIPQGVDGPAVQQDPARPAVRLGVAAEDPGKALQDDGAIAQLRTRRRIVQPVVAATGHQIVPPAVPTGGIPDLLEDQVVAGIIVPVVGRGHQQVAVDVELRGPNAIGVLQEGVDLLGEGSPPGRTGQAGVEFPHRPEEMGVHDLAGRNEDRMRVPLGPLRAEVEVAEQVPAGIALVKVVEPAPRGERSVIAPPVLGHDPVVLAQGYGAGIIELGGRVAGLCQGRQAG